MAGFGSDFGANMKKYADGVGKSLEQTTRAVTLSLFKGIIMDTPVDTGRLRGNWQASTGTPIYTEIDREDKNGSVVLAEVAGTIDPYGVNYLSNNLPYAKRREQEGKRPVVNGVGKGGGFVEKNMARIERNIKEAVAGAKP